MNRERRYRSRLKRKKKQQEGGAKPGFIGCTVREREILRGTPLGNQEKTGGYVWTAKIDIYPRVLPNVI